MFLACSRWNLQHVITKIQKVNPVGSVVRIFHNIIKDGRQSRGTTGSGRFWNVLDGGSRKVVGG